MFPRNLTLRQVPAGAASSTAETGSTVPGSAASNPAGVGGKRKGEPLESERKPEAPGLDAEGTLDLAAALMVRRARGKPFESTQQVQRLKAAQQGMRAAARSNPLGACNLLPDLERSEFRNRVVFLTQRSVGTMLVNAALAPAHGQTAQALRACWPAALLDDYKKLDLWPEKHEAMLSVLAYAAMGRLGGVDNCQEKTTENIVHHEAAILENRPTEENPTPSAVSKGSLVYAAAGDHGWLEVQHPAESDGSDLVPRADDLIMDNWSGERPVPLLREDAIYPASAHYVALADIPPSLAEKLPQYFNEFVDNLRACPAVAELSREKIAEHFPHLQFQRNIAGHLQRLRQEKLPASSLMGLFQDRPHPLRPDVRAEARKGLAEFEGFSAAARHGDIVATKIGRDLGMPVREATRHALRISEVAKEMVTEPLERRLIAGKDAVFDDSEPLRAPGAIITALGQLGHDVPELHKALWHLEDTLLTADAKTLENGVRDLRNWWRQADVPLPIHAHVFDILSNDRIGNSLDFGECADMIAKLPVLAQSEALLDKATLFLGARLQGRPPSNDESIEFTLLARSAVERECRALGNALSESSHAKIKKILNLASATPDSSASNY